MFTFNAIARQSINAQGAVSPKGIYRLEVSASHLGDLSARTIVPFITQAQCPDWVSTAWSLLMVGQRTGANSADVYL